MTPKPSKELRDIAPAAVPEDLMKKMHEANEHLAHDRKAYEKATSEADYDQAADVSQASQQLRKTEVEEESVETEIREAIQPPGVPPSKS